MFKKLVDQLKNLSREPVSFDPATLDDPVALNVEWTPLKSGGANFGTHALVTVGTHRAEFRSTLGAKLFYLVFLLAGLGVMIGFGSAASKSGGFDAMGAWVPMLVGSVFVCVGGGMLYYGTTPIVFDTSKGYFWKGRKAPDEVFDKSSLKHFSELKDIYALQLISEYCRGNKSSYYSYELNLVLDTGERINVVDHGNRNRIVEDAETLSSLLGKPIWDAM